MIISSIEKGTLFDIEVFTGDFNAGEKFAGVLNDTEGDVILSIEGKGLYERCEECGQNFNMLLTFYRGSEKYSFYCKSKSRQILDHVALTEIVALTRIKKESRRSAPRFASTVQVSVFDENGTSSVEPLCTGQADDISSNSMCFLTDYELDIHNKGKFSLEFTLFGKDFFRLSARLLHSKKAPFYTQYNNGYIFLFDFSGWPDEKARLVDVILKDRLRAMNI